MNCVDWNVERINAGDLDEQIKQIVDGLPANIVRQWQPTANRSNEMNESILFNNRPLKKGTPLKENSPVERPEFSTDHRETQRLGLSYRSKTPLSQPPRIGLSSQTQEGPFFPAREKQVRSILRQVQTKPPHEGLRHPITEMSTHQHPDPEIEVYSESSDESDNSEEMTVHEVVKPQIRPQLSVGQLLAPTSRPISPNCLVPGSGSNELISDIFEKMGSAENGAAGLTLPQADITTSHQRDVEGEIRTSDAEFTEEQEKSKDPDYIPVDYDVDESDEEEDEVERNFGKSHAKGFKPRSRDVDKRKRVEKGSSSHGGHSWPNSPNRQKTGPRKQKTYPCEFECPECPYVTRGERGFRKHRGVHRNPRSVYCKVCRRPFSKNWYLQAHMRREHCSNLTTTETFDNRENFNDSTKLEADGSCESGEYGQPTSAENEDFGEHLATQAEGLSWVDNAHVANVYEPCNYSTEDDTEYFDDQNSFSHFCNENLFKKSEKRERISPNNKTTKTCGQPRPRNDSPGAPTKRRTMSSKFSHIEKNTTHPEYEEPPQKLSPDARSLNVPENTIALVTNFDDFSQRPYSCVLCFFRTGEPDALQEHCRNHLTGGTNDSEDNNISVLPDNLPDSFSQSTDLTPHTEYPINISSPPLTRMKNSVPVSTRSNQTIPSPRPYLLPSPATFPRLASSPTLINPWMTDNNNSQPPYQETRTEDLMEQGKDYEKDPSNMQQYKCRYCPLRVNILRRLMRHFENCHKDIVMAKSVQACRYIDVINLT